MSPSAPLPSHAEVLVVGAGLTGLSCAALLHREGVDVHVIDAADGVGGRVRTDEVDGFLLDRGFQVLLTAYEEVQAQVELEALDLAPFRPGSLVWSGERLETLADPWRNPTAAFASLGARVGTLRDKLRLAGLRRSLLAEGPEACFAAPDRTTRDELAALGFSDGFVEGFFRPFLGGVFLERGLATSSRLFRYYFRCFAAGDATVPARGMQRLPEHLAVGLDGRITLEAEVTSASAREVTLRDGRVVTAGRVVLAVDGAAAAGLLGTTAPPFKATVTSYFSAPAPPVDAAMLVLDGVGAGPANHVAVLSNVSRAYAPDGAHLVSVSGVDGAAEDPAAFRREAPEQLRRWFGDGVDRWTHLRTYRIPHALPHHPPGGFDVRAGVVLRPDGLIVAGDHVAFGAIQGALLSGRRAAEAVRAGS